MSDLQIIDKLCQMLEEAQQIIKSQAELLAMHGIQTGSGELEEKRTALLCEIERSI